MAFNVTPRAAGSPGPPNICRRLPTTSPKFILLAADGAPTCGTGGMWTPRQRHDGRAALAAGFKTFVVGIATGGTTADDHPEQHGQRQGG